MDTWSKPVWRWDYADKCWRRAVDRNSDWPAWALKNSAHYILGYANVAPIKNPARLLPK